MVSGLQRLRYGLTASLALLNPTMSLAEGADPQNSSVGRALTSAPASEHIIDGNGMIRSLPKVDLEQLRKRLQGRYQVLQRQEERAAQAVKGAMMDMADAAIVIIMPGGLLYAAYKTQQKHKAEKHLAYLNQRRAQLFRDLLSIRKFSGEVTLAAR